MTIWRRDTVNLMRESMPDGLALERITPEFTHDFTPEGLRRTLVSRPVRTTQSRGTDGSRHMVHNVGQPFIWTTSLTTNPNLS